ncbi:hypothetical protein GH714_017433 [Hevea brasiliensis]|uniref:Uncharacterized protein n=1 Tax=Hevea brasiliensis TaxID=3981 RepID=A0A6A6K5C2_HEVBR|nr:hypothetical protein GH714_017433 [Hevea brasiliensis]
MTEEFEKYREMERLFQEASDLAYDDNKIKFVKQRLAELKRDLLSWNDGMIAPTVGPHNSQTPGSQTQGNVTDAVINPIVSELYQAIIVLGIKEPIILLSITMELVKKLE